jgi:iron complex outermembrane receptor protein
MQKSLFYWLKQLEAWTGIAFIKQSINQQGYLSLACLVALLMLELPAEAQSNRIVQGKVESETGIPLAGVTVLLKDSKVGATTDISGNYKLSISGKTSILVFSHVGFISQEIRVSDQTKLDVILKTDSKALDEVVVVGYGSQNRKDVTGAVATISSENFNQGAITNPLQQIAGRAAGVNVTQIGSEPGSEQVLESEVLLHWWVVTTHWLWLMGFKEIWIY